MEGPHRAGRSTQVKEEKGRVLLSDIKLVSSQVVHKRLDQEVSGEVEDQAEGDGDGQRRQSLLKDGQQQQRQTQTLRQVSRTGESATGETLRLGSGVFSLHRRSTAPRLTFTHVNKLGLMETR